MKRCCASMMGMWGWKDVIIVSHLWFLVLYLLLILYLFSMKLAKAPSVEKNGDHSPFPIKSHVFPALEELLGILGHILPWLWVRV